MLYLCRIEENPSTGSKDIPLTRLWPWKWGQGHQNLIGSLACHIDVPMQVWRKSSTGSKDIPFTRLCPWKWGQGHQNLISSLACHIDVSMQVWRKSIHWFKRYRGYKNLSFKSSCALKSKIKVTKHNQLLSLHQCGLVEFHRLVHEISWVQVYVNYTYMRSRSPKTNQLLTLSQWHIYMFEENPSTGLKDIPLLRLSPWKLAQGHQNLMSS